MNPSRRTLFSQATPGVLIDTQHTGPHPEDPSLPAPDPLHTLLNRCCYGITPTDWKRGTQLDYTGWLTEQLNANALDTSAVEATVAARWPRVNMSPEQLMDDVAIDDGSQKAASDLRAATIYRQLYSPRQLYETMVEFWGDHFHVSAVAPPIWYLKCLDDREVIRTHALGNFRDLLHASARSLAMLHYLDNVTNTSAGPNENYARELMELHTLGVHGGYSEQDVIEVARCFTGWSVTGLYIGSPVFVFVPARHDNGKKIVLDLAIRPNGGIQDGNLVLDLLASHPSTARHIATKLCTRFIGDNPQPSAIDAVAAAFTRTNGNIPSVLLTLFGSQEFISSYDRKLRRPQDYLLATLRSTDARIEEVSVAHIIYNLSGLGQVPFRWPTPDGLPDEIQDWAGGGAMLSRWNWAFAVCQGNVPGVAIDVTALIGAANTPTLLVDQLSDRILHRALSIRDRDSLIAFAANAGSATAVLDTEQLQARAREVLGLLLSSPYLQYR